MRIAAIVLLLFTACATRPHAGEKHVIEGIASKPVELFVPKGNPRELVIHLHGTPVVVDHAVAVMTVHLGAGSRAYEQPFSDPSLFARLVGAADERMGRAERIWVTAFSAGYGGVRALLRDESATARIDGVLLLDGLHTGYVEEKTVDPEQLAPFVRLAERAARGEVRFVYTHSEIVPGTYASTTETADALLAALQLRRAPVRRRIAGMRQLSEARRGRFHVLGFAGSTAPDHMDHLHGIATFLRLLRR